MSISISNPISSLPESMEWGRNSRARMKNSLGGLLLIISCPLVVILNWIALEKYQGSYAATLHTALAHGPVRFLLNHFPTPSRGTVIGYAAWVLFQAFLFIILPGEACYGQRTPGGNLLKYTPNGLTAWFVTHTLFLAASTLGVIDPAIIARHWSSLLIVVNVFGLVLGLLIQLKGYYFPSHPEDRKISGSWIFDFWAGVELNPRIGSFDIKFFMNARPGIVAWTLINLSFAAYQKQTLGYVTYSMLLVVVLQSFYVIDLFCNESWYTRTIDISHDHFGFMLSWGDSTWLPTFYTLQAQYLARYPTHLSSFEALFILALGVVSYAMFRLSNYQRDYVRSRDGDAKIWGRQAKIIRCKYRTSDGKEHNTLLLASGWWGVARHANYLVDLIQTFAWCLPCGFKHVLPWLYFFYMIILLVHQARRDDRRCKAKYGEKWDEYCRAVPYQIIPGIY